MSEAELLGFVRRHDPDRFLAALFAPPVRRPALLVLCAFNHELARAREAARAAPPTTWRCCWRRRAGCEGRPGTPPLAFLAAPVYSPRQVTVARKG
jgi:15-cis-phytoene synthase